MVGVFDGAEVTPATGGRSPESWDEWCPAYDDGNTGKSISSTIASAGRKSIQTRDRSNCCGMARK